MQVLFKTRYDQDIDHLVDRGERFRLVTVIVLAIVAPLVFDAYYLSELSMFLVYALAGIGLIGADRILRAGLVRSRGIPGHRRLYPRDSPRTGRAVRARLAFRRSVFRVIGAAVGRAAGGMHGFYLAIATLAFGIITETVIGEWESLTGGHMGLEVPAIELFGYEIAAAWQQYYLVLGILLFFVWGVANLMRSPSGRAMIAVRESETSARSLGVNIHNTKIFAFFLSASITGLAGGLLAHQLLYLAPETFGVSESLKLLLMIIRGRAWKHHRAVFGAVFVSFLPNVIDLLRLVLPSSLADQAGFEQLLFGLIIALFIILEPEGNLWAMA